MGAEQLTGRALDDAAQAARTSTRAQTTRAVFEGPDLSGPSLDKFSIYTRAGIPEIWRHDGERLAIFESHGEEYVEVAVSKTLPPLTGEALSKLIEESFSPDYRDLDARGTGVGARARQAA